MPVQIPRILIAGTHSGCGKTTIARGLMQAFSERGLVVQPFKVGPDFIDPTHHTAICGRPSRNLDPFMMGEEGVKNTFARASRGADIAVIEGVMGMYDGLDGTRCASSSHVADILSAPVVLVVDVKGSSASANAVVAGFCHFPGGERITGVIFNRVGSERHRLLIEHTLETRAFGWMKRRKGLYIESRHLGLMMAGETGADQVPGSAVEQDCDIDALISLARVAPPLHDPVHEKKIAVECPVIGVARDEAFCFYYQDNIDRLESAGAVIRYFSPVRDPFPEVDALYLGGGYPELYAAALASAPAKGAIKAAADNGLPIYAECGGLMYLTRSIVTDREHEMAGILPADSEMTQSMQALGYSDGCCTGANSYIRSGMVIRGHEFHYSRLQCDRDARFLIQLSRGKGISSGSDGLSEHEVLGSYTHSYFSDDFAHTFVKAATRYGRR